MQSILPLSPALLADFYKTGHLRQYPEGTTFCYSNFTPRAAKYFTPGPGWDKKYTFFGFQAVLKWLLVDLWNEGFFKRPKDEVVAEYKRVMDFALGPNAVAIEHIAALHDLGYLPVEIKALPEGSRVNIRVPAWTIKNTDPRFYWLVNYLETQLSAESWKPMTSTTTAFEFYRLLHHFAKKTGSPLDFVQWQGHDFSMRGMSGVHDAAMCGMGHLAVGFTGTDTIPALLYLEKFYGANIEKELVGGSVPATEHSVMCMGGKADEVETFRRLISELYPTGIVSIVSDTWDFWNVVTNTATTLKDEIMARNGKVVFRPDSGDPVDVICGSAIPILDLKDETIDYATRGKSGNIFHFVDRNGFYWEYRKDYGRLMTASPTPEMKGAIKCLWEVFGGTETSTGHKLLDGHVGLIYGDSITLDRAQRILNRLDQLGFASANIVFGVGSFTYQGVTRDTLGTAIKATYGIVNSEHRSISKAPKTDDGTKNSATGLLRIDRVNNDYVLVENVNEMEELGGCLSTVFYNSSMPNQTTLAEVRNRIAFEHGFLDVVV
jgi:nicotinamide phosphoribosyltransferase